jgi:uncharacterized RDD family membrane protein YckC
MTANIKPANILRRLGAICYDSLVAFAILFFATAFALLANKGESLQPHQSLFLGYLIIIAGLYFVWSWQKGQSLGMLAWKLKVVDKQGQSINLTRAWVRYLLSLLGTYCLGITFVWCLFDPNNQTLHDRLSGSMLICNK